MSLVSRGDAAKKALLELPEKMRPREGGLRSFLTRALIVSQMVVAEHFIGSSASAGPSDDDLRAGNGNVASEPVQEGGRELTVDALDTGVGEGAAAAASHSTEAAAPTFKLGSYVPPPYAGIGHAGGRGRWDDDGAGGGTQQAVYGDALSAPEGGLGSSTPDPMSSLAGLEDVLHDLGGLIESAVAPVAHTVVDLVQALPLAPLSLTVDTLVTDVVYLADSLVDGLTAVPAVVWDGAVASAGQIVFDDVPIPAAQALDVLFAKGLYTDYNLALQTPAVGHEGAIAGGPMGTASPLVQILIADDQVHQEASAVGSRQQVIALPSALEEMAHRGLGDIIA